MKLLLDQNLSRKLVSKLNNLFPGTEHVSKFNLERKDDAEIRKFANENQFIIVTQDADFFEMMLMKGFPPKIIWLRCGNTSSQTVLKLIINNSETIHRLDTDSTIGCIELE